MLSSARYLGIQTTNPRSLGLCAFIAERDQANEIPRYKPRGYGSPHNHEEIRNRVADDPQHDPRGEVSVTKFTALRPKLASS
jgi:hypothetical protein